MLNCSEIANQSDCLKHQDILIIDTLQIEGCVT